MTNAVKYWINTVSRDHVLKGREGGFVQAGHGKQTPLKRLTKDDLMLFYSPRTKLQQGAKLQRFTALARITGEESYQVEMSPSFCPFRRDASFLACEEADIHPLISELDFISDKRHWGYKFRVGLFEIQEEDFGRIARAMNADLSGVGDNQALTGN